MITIRTIPHSQQRYETVGDWEYQGAPWLMGVEDNYRISVSRLPDRRYEFLVGLHELVEAVLCQHRGITQEDVDAFDRAFERERIEGSQEPDAEPGDHPDAPYHKEHVFATSIERLMAAELGVDWAEYEKATEAL